MNRKIFTLLASALMLFSTAFYAIGATPVSDKCVGDLVRSLPDGVSVGMYHIRVDAINLPDRLNPVDGDGVQQYEEVPFQSLTKTILEAAGVKVPAGYKDGDTLVLAAYESGVVGIISMSDLKKSLAKGDAKTADLQATMWCTNVFAPAQSGAWPTFHFMNKALNLNLDWAKTGTTQVGEADGWMFSNAYLNGQLNYTQPMYRRNKSDNETYNVLTLGNVTRTANGKFTADNLLSTTNKPIIDFVADTIPFMLKFSVVKVSPMVLSKNDINTKITTEDTENFIQLLFDPENIGTETYPNYFGKKIKADDPATGGCNNQGSGAKTAAALGYVSVMVEGDGYIWNVGTKKNDDALNAARYTNDLSLQHIWIHSGGNKTLDTDNKNYNYRFVYFPSEDSLVINAYSVGHLNHSEFLTNEYHDTGDYIEDMPSAAPYYYGLYNNEIQKALIVRMQDLNGSTAGGNLMTIGKHPANVRMYFGIGCQQVYNDAIEVTPGIYTIWDNRGRCLGVRMYNGSYSPQWMELAEGECPDRIPSYQWVVEQSMTSKKRIDIYNREFGNLKEIDSDNSIIAMYNVLVTYKKGDKATDKRGNQLFTVNNSGKFAYLASGYTSGQYEPIENGYVQGRLLPAVDVTDCQVVGEKGNGGGFRPVNSEYVKDPYLGYKHFVVGKDDKLPDFGKSEDNGSELGMDYNAWIFNYLHNYTNGTSSEEDWNISMQPNLSDTILRVEEGEATGFQFQVGTNIRKKNYVEETYGYPYKKNFAKHTISWPSKEQIDDLGLGQYFPTVVSYSQEEAAYLQRYYYELKVADYYEYRDGLSQQYVVLKGAKNDGSDARNAKKYGVADIWADKDPFKFANIYLRETYFLTKDKVQGEERKSTDPSRRVYYSLLDRIEGEQITTLTNLGLEVSDTLSGDDGTSKYNLVTLSVNDNSAFIEAQGKTVSSARVSAFALLNKNYPLYRRLNSIEDDGANVEGTFKNDGNENFSLGNGNSNLDAPKILRIYRQKNELVDYLYEDALSQYSYGMGPNFDPATVTGGINFLGIHNIKTYPEKPSADGTLKNNYNLFIDTAFVNRGTGPIKPQYLIGVDPIIVKAQKVNGLDACQDPATFDIPSYIRGRYLVNATDSGRQLGSDGSHTYPVRNFDYINGVDRDNPFISNTSWDRLIFVDAIHVNDRLYIVSRLEDKLGKDWETQFTIEDVVTHEKFLNLNALMDNKAIEGDARVKENSSAYGTYYDFGDWDDYHNDVCFSLRFARADAENANVTTGLGGSDNKSKQFLIESETTNRTVFGGGGVGGNEKIAPVQGGWIKLNNGVPVLSRTSYEDAINQAEVFNVEKPNNADEFTKGESTSNEAIAANVKVIAGNGEVTILNAAGKKVTVSNMLGQTIVNTVLASDNATVKVAGGVVVVAIEGEKTVKAIVK